MSNSELQNQATEVQGNEECPSCGCVILAGEECDCDGAVDARLADTRDDEPSDEVDETNYDPYAGTDVYDYAEFDG